MAAHVLLIEDNEETARLLARALRSGVEPFDVTAVFSAREGLERLGDEGFDCVLLDYRLPDGDGLECLRKIRQRHSDVPVIIITGGGSEEIAVEAMKLGATDYIVKHGKYLLTVPLVVREALGRRELARTAERYKSALRSTRREVTRLRRELRERFQLEGIIGESSAIEQALVLAERAAQTDATVLIEGETGTGKDLFARAIHYHGARARGPFLALNCAALAEGLLESELFGHVRGAYTGADRPRRGLFEEASTGTLFLDEVGEMSPSIQAKLLRVLEDREIRPVGGTGVRQVDVRVIAATNRDLGDAVRDGFRLDLYHRLRVFPIRLPPLRERREDIRLLAMHFLEKCATQEGKRLRGFEPEVLTLFERHPWPGNVRELEHEVHRLTICAEDGERIPATLLSATITDGAQAPGPADATRPLREIVKEVELATIQARLREHGYHRSATARSLGITREALWAKIRQFGFALPRRGSSSE
jgi:DNA-binding NtrC family response regulator